MTRATDARNGERIPWRKRKSGVTNGWAIATIMGLGVLPTLTGIGFYRYVVDQRRHDCEDRVEQRDELRTSFLTLFDLIASQVETDEGRAFVEELRGSVLPPISLDQCLEGGTTL